MTKSKKRFITLKSHKGIRKDLFGKYQARKIFNGKQVSKSFTNLDEALKWKYENVSTSFKEEISFESERVNLRLNGFETQFKFLQIWELYKLQHLPSVARTTRTTMERSLKDTILYLEKYRMVDINAVVIDEMISKFVEKTKQSKRLNRYSFKRELKMMKTLLNWYRENYDPMFMNPILKRHFVLGKLRDKQKKTEKMNIKQVKEFFNCFDNEFWRDFAVIHFLWQGGPKSLRDYKLRM